jgi:hypothetical protein
MDISNMVKNLRTFHSINPVENGLSNRGTPTTVGMQTTVVGVLNQEIEKYEIFYLYQPVVLVTQLGYSK